MLLKVKIKYGNEATPLKVTGKERVRRRHGKHKVKYVDVLMYSKSDKQFLRTNNSQCS